MTSLQQVTDELYENMHIPVAGADEIGEYLLQTSGKHLRPLCVLLAGRACGDENPRQIQLAVVLELIHTATLLHDDVVDDSSLRRGHYTVNKMWSNAHSVLTGDYLYSRAFVLMSGIEMPELFKSLATATNEIATGELHQLTSIGRLSLSEEEYHQIIRRKTGALFSIACSGAALLTGAAPDIQKSLGAFGMLLGEAFQVTDDLLDYTGTHEQTGKNPGDDLREYKITLPLIRALQTADADTRAALERCIRDDSDASIDESVRLVRQTDALEYTRAQAQALYQQACENLQPLPESPYRQALQDLAEFAIKRTG